MGSIPLIVGSAGVMVSMKQTHTINTPRKDEANGPKMITVLNQHNKLHEMLLAPGLGFVVTTEGR